MYEDSTGKKAHVTELIKQHNTFPEHAMAKHWCPQVVLQIATFVLEPY